MNKAKITTSLYKQLDWFENEGSEEEKKSAKRMLQQFKVRSCFCELRGGCDREHGGPRFLPMYGLRFHPVTTGIEENHKTTVLEWRWTTVPPISFYELTEM